MPPTEYLQRVPERMLARLEHQGIFTTGLFLEVSETPTRRIYLADQIGVTINDINEWRDEALLLNLASFARSDQRLLTQAGIVGLDDLLDLEYDEFHERVVSAAYTLNLDPPPEPTILGWYEQAQTLAEE